MITLKLTRNQARLLERMLNSSGIEFEYQTKRGFIDLEQRAALEMGHETGYVRTTSHRLWEYLNDKLEGAE